MLALQRAHETLAATFRRHGAIELTLPPLWLKQVQQTRQDSALVSCGNWLCTVPSRAPLRLAPHVRQAPVVPGAPESLAAYMIESGGHLVGLHAGGRLPLCQYLAVHAPLTTFKRYTQGVAHRLPPPSTKPSALGFTAQLVADFDIVATQCHPDATASAAAGTSGSSKPGAQVSFRSLLGVGAAPLPPDGATIDAIP